MAGKHRRPRTHRWQSTNKVVAIKAVSRIGSRAFSSAALGICLLLAARQTDISSFGQFMLAYSVALIAGIVFGVGAPVRVLRNAVEAPWLPGVLFCVHTALNSAAVVIVLAVCAFNEVGVAVYAGVLFGFGDTLQNYAVAQLTAQDKHLAANSAVLLHRFIPLVAVLAMVILGSEHFYSNLLVAFCFPIALGLVLPALYCRFYRTFDLYREVFNGWLGYWGYSISGTLGQLQVPVLGVVASSAVVASFSMASKVVGPITILTASLSAVFVPELTKRLGDRLQFDSLFRSLLIVSSGYLVAVALLAWPVALLVVGIAGPQYRDSTVLVSAMVVGAAISGCSQAFNTKLLALGSPGSATRAILVGGSVALLLIVGIGATDSTGLLYVVPIAAQLVVLLLMWWSSSRAAKVVSWDKRCVVQ